MVELSFFLYFNYFVYPIGFLFWNATFTAPFPLLYLLSKWNTQALAFNSELYPVIDEWSAKGWIDSTDNLRGFKAYVYQGTRDRLIYPSQLRGLCS